MKRFSDLKFGHKILLSGAVAFLIIIFVNGLILDATLIKINGVLYESTAVNILNTASGMESQVAALDSISYNMIASRTVQDTLMSYQSDANTFSRKTMRDTLINYMYSYIAIEQSVRSVSLVLPDTTIVIGNRASLLPDDEKNALLSRARAAMGASVYDYSSDGAVFRHARQIRESNNVTHTELAVLIVDCDTRQMVASNLAPDNVLLIMGDGFSFSSDGRARALNIPDTQSGYNIIKTDEGTYFITHMRSHYADWQYIIMTPYEEIREGVLSWQRTLFVLTTLLIGVAILINSLMSKSITKPIIRLAEAIKDSDAQNVDIAGINRGYINRRDEVGELYRGFNSMRDNTRRLIEENYAKEIVLKEAQFKALQMQISPHFLYNTLDSIHFLAKINHQTEIATLVQSLGILLRSSINDHNDIVTLEHELRIAREYFAIQRIRFGDRLTCVIDVDETLSDVMLPKMTLQPILENSIKYALESAEGECEIRLWNEDADGEVILCVSDNGIRFDIEHLRSVATGEVESGGRNSIGLYNINQRIRLLFGANYGLTFAVRDQHLVVQIHLPPAKEDE